MKFSNSLKILQSKISVSQNFFYIIPLLFNYESELDRYTFIPLSEISWIRRRLIDLLDSANKASYPFDYRKIENLNFAFPYKSVDFRDNISNSLSEKLYSEHGIHLIEKALETDDKRKIEKGKVLMTTRHCILRELGLCKKKNKNPNKESNKNQKEKLTQVSFSEPLMLINDEMKFSLRFNCDRCEMEVLNL